MTHAGLFSGIGGFSLAAAWMGWQNVFEVEIDDWCRKVLHKNFPLSQLFSDVCTFDGRPFRGLIDVLSGGFPCQPWSDAGQKLGTADPRHLWPQFLRIIREIQPRFVVGENVRGLLSWNGGIQFEAVCADLEAEGYTVLPLLLPACSVGAPHKRDRFWFVAYANGRGRIANQSKVCSRPQSEGPAYYTRDGGVTTNAIGGQFQRRGKSRILGSSATTHDSQTPEWERYGDAVSDCREVIADTNHHNNEGQQNAAQQEGWAKPKPGHETTTHSTCERWQKQPPFRISHEASRTGPSDSNSTAAWFRLTEPPLCSPNDGVSARLVRTASPRAKQLKAYGNAIVPQVAYQIFKAIEATA